MNREKIKELMHNCYACADFSTDLSTKNGAVLYHEPTGEIIGGGYNTIRPLCCTTPERLQKPLKYPWTTHAEQDAILNAVRHKNGHRVPGSTLVAAWAACADCAKVIVGAGIKKLVRHIHPAMKEQGSWHESIAIGDEMMRAAGVEIIDFEEHLGVQVLFSGKLIEV